jgi:hypothetical protein
MKDAGHQPASNVPRFECEDWNQSNVRRRVQNALGYLDWQSHKYRADRFGTERWRYLNGRRLLYDTFFAAKLGPQLVPFSVFASPTPEQDAPHVTASWSRGKLVDALLAADPVLTDRRLLSHLSRRKLSVMLDRAWEMAARQERRRA